MRFLAKLTGNNPGTLTVAVLMLALLSFGLLELLMKVKVR
jgi:hypothetical protein